MFGDTVVKEIIQVFLIVPKAMWEPPSFSLALRTPPHGLVGVEGLTDKKFSATPWYYTAHTSSAENFVSALCRASLLQVAEGECVGELLKSNREEGQQSVLEDHWGFVF